MKIYVDLDHVDITEYTQIESGEYNTNKINFIFTPEYKDLVKVAIFGCKLDTEEPKFYKVYLTDDSCYIPPEVLEISDVITIGCYGYKASGETLNLRYSPTPVKVIVYEGSFREGAENSSPLTPTEVEQIMSRIATLDDEVDDLDGRVTVLEGKACDVDSIRERVTDLEVDVDTINNKIDIIESDIDELEGDIANTYSKEEVNTLVEAKVDTTTYNSGQAAQDSNINDLLGLVEGFPRTNYAEGSNISLANTLKWKLEYEDNKVVKGNTSQNTLNGYQLLNLRDSVTLDNAGIEATCNYNTGEITLNGTATGNSFIAFNVDFKVGDIISIANNNPTTNSNVATRLLNSVTNNTTSAGANCSVVNNSKSGTTLTEDMNRFQIRIASGVTLSNFILKPMVEKGNTNHTWEPYCGGIPSPNPSYPQDINVVTGTQEVKICGKNLLDKNTITSGYRITNQGELTQQTGYYSSDFIQVIPNTQYTKNSPTADGYHKFAFYSSNNESSFISYSNTNTSTTPQNCKYLRICGLLTELDTTQLEVGSSATTYTPYTSTTHTLHLGSLELCKIGNYQDYIYKDNGKWYKYGTIDKVTLLSSMCTSVTASASYGTLCYLNFNGKVDNSNICAMSDKFVGVSYDNRTSIPTGYRIFTSDGSGVVTIRFPNNSDIDTLQEVKDFLDNNVTKCYYVLGTPTSTEITDTTLINELEELYNIYSYSGTTNISISGNLPFIMKVRSLTLS